MSNLVITEEKVLEAASKCGQAKEILSTLFPEVFKKGWPEGSLMTFCLPERTWSVIFDILSNVGGHPDGPRGATDLLYDALCRSGIAKADCGGSGGSIILPDSWDRVRRRT